MVFSFIVVTIIVGIVVAIIGYVMVMGEPTLSPSTIAPSLAPSRQPSASVSPLATPSVEGSTWKTYRNTAYGFSFHYLSFLTISEPYPNGPFLHLYRCREEVKDTSDEVIECTEDEYAITLYIVGRPYDSQNILQYYDARISTLPLSSLVWAEETHILGQMLLSRLKNGSYTCQSETKLCLSNLVETGTFKAAIQL
jgi:hypothetical protein